MKLDTPQMTTKGPNSKGFGIKLPTGELKNFNSKLNLSKLSRIAYP